MSDFFPKLIRRVQYKGAPKVYGYKRYRNEICEDCLYRCAYCDSHEGDIGGAPNMELDHFRPKSRFKALEDDPTNLIYACRSCNRLKWHDWPPGDAEGWLLGEEGYLPPFECDRLEYFRLDADGTIIPLKAPGAYVARRLGLNRPLLKRLRLRKRLVSEAKVLLEALKADLQVRLESEIASEEATLLQQCFAAFELQLALLNLFTVGQLQPKEEGQA